MMEKEQITPLRRDSMHPDPLQHFSGWLQEAEQADLPLANAMTLATSDSLGKPSARIVLLRGVDERGLVFFTNYESRKGRELLQNPVAALLFHWPSLSRQVRVEGRVHMLEANDSDQYFANRPRGHQIAAHASAQSRVIKDRIFLEEQFRNTAQSFAGKVVPRPLHWGGYRVVPELVEFWQEGESRLHDRLRYRRDTGGIWMIERLAP